MRKVLLLILATAILITGCSGSKNASNDDISEVVYDDRTEQKIYEEVTAVFNAIRNFDEVKIKKQFKEGYFSDFISDKEALKLLLSKMEYTISSIDVNDSKNKAFVEMNITSVDTAKIVYEMLMFNYSFSGIAENNKKLEKTMSDLAVSIVNRNLNNIKESSINITLIKEGFAWKVVNDVIIRDAIIGSSISNDYIYEKVSENTMNKRKSIAEAYKFEEPSMTLEQFTVKRMTEFCEDYLSEHINDYPFTDVFATAQ